MAKVKYFRSTSREVKNEMHRYKRGKAKSGKGGRVKSRKQAIAIALSKARKLARKHQKRKPHKNSEVRQQDMQRAPRIRIVRMHHR